MGNHFLIRTVTYLQTHSLNKRELSKVSPIKTHVVVGDSELTKRVFKYLGQHENERNHKNLINVSGDSFPRPKQLALTAADFMPKLSSFEELLARVNCRIGLLDESQADSGSVGCPSAKTRSTNSNSGRRWNSPSTRALYIQI